MSTALLFSATIGVLVASVIFWSPLSLWQESLQRLCAWDQLTQARLPFIPGYSPVSALCQTQLAHPVGSPDACQTDAGAGCQYKQVEVGNHDLLALLKEATRTAYFRYFKVNLFCDCPHWPDDSMCALEACSVCECDESEVPAAWKKAEADSCQNLLDKVSEESAVNRSISDSTEAQLTSLSSWRGLDNPWLPEADGDVEYSYINLLVNPERYTGYTGEHAHRIWNAIYSQNCFKDVHAHNGCNEESLVFYRIISGVHASISMHLIREYLLDESANVWGPNFALFSERMADPGNCDHVRNLYFAYLFVLRAFARAAPALKQVHFFTGMVEEDVKTQALMGKILSSPALESACDLPFDIGRMWKGEFGAQLKEQLQVHFQNITTIMDCVGCEKCKLWGKLQFLGVATALKILFASDDCFREGLAPSQVLGALNLERNEVIALVNLLTKLAHSVATYRTMADQLEARRGTLPCVKIGDYIA
eukprot:jgi/Ulvmu1/4891/UM020_0177.1